MAGRPSGPKTRCNGQWTEARYKSFIKGALRQATMKWAPIQTCLSNARTRRGFYKCAMCKEEVPATVKEGRKRVKNVHVDHIVPAVSLDEGFTTWDDVIEGLFSELDNLQVLCKGCHSEKTLQEANKTKKRGGFYKTHPREYTTYVSMKGRCTNPKKSDYEYYGGRGIRVCDRWIESFENFLSDMGPRPDGHTLDRIDVNGDYEPSNCRWADWETQCKNRSTSVIVSFNGEENTITKWAEKLGISRTTIGYRLRNDFTVEEALGFCEKPTKQELLNRRMAAKGDE